jgi:hypothetical protein
MRALRQSCHRLTLGFLRRGLEERREQLGELAEFGFRRMRKAFEAGDGRHQDNVLLPDSQRSFKVSKPVAHANTHTDTQNNKDGNRTEGRIGGGAIPKPYRLARISFSGRANTDGTDA